MPAQASPIFRDPTELLALMVDAVEDYAIYMLDPDGYVMSWNSGAERCKGYTASEIIGRHYSCFFLPSAVASGESHRELEQARTTGHFHKEVWRVKKDGSRFWAMVTLTPVRDSDGHLLGFAKVTRDLSDRREQDIALRRAMDETKQAHQAKTEFLANMSHELRTPLNAILGFSEMIMTEMFGSLSSRNREYLGHIHDSGNHLLALINDVLDLAKIDANELTLAWEDTDIALLARDAVETIRPQAIKAGVHAMVEIPGSVHLRCDRRRMIQIFLNLLSNSVKFTPAGGRVILRAAAKDDLISIEVEDTGIGIASVDIPRALARFGQIENVQTRRTQGTGLGLPLVKQLVEMHGGALALESERGVGTLVRLSFPVDLPNAPAAAE